MGALAGTLVGFGYGGDDAVETGAELGAAAMEDGHLLLMIRSGRSPT